MKKYVKKFSTWSEQKQKIDTYIPKNPLYLKEREVWWVSVGVNIGTEIDGKNQLFERPVLVFRKVGRDQFYGLPITSKEKFGPFYHLVAYGESTGNVCLSQLRVFSSKRLIRKIGVVQLDDYANLKNKLSSFFAGERL